MISVVITAYNERDCIIELLSRIQKVLDDTKYSYEVIVVDDGSNDGTDLVVRKFGSIDNRFKLISLSRNFGQHSAIAAAMKYAIGSVVVWMDADLQDLPEEMTKLIEEQEKGYDIVYGLRENRTDSFFKKLNAKLFFRLFKKMTGFEIPEGISTYRILSRRAVDAFNSMPEHSRFTAGMMAWLGFKVGSVPLKHGERKSGRSKYNFLKLLTLSFDAFFSFSSYPLRLASHIGIVVSLLSFCVGLYMIFKKILTGFIISGYASLIVSIFFLSGLQFFFMGIVGEYIARIFKDVQRRPIYIVKETFNIDIKEEIR